MGIKPRISFHVELLTEKYEEIIPIIEEIHKRQIDCEIAKIKTYDSPDVPEEHELTVSIPEDLQKSFERLCKIAHCDIHQKIIEILDSVVYSAEVSEDGLKVDNF